MSNYASCEHVPFAKRTKGPFMMDVTGAQGQEDVVQQPIGAEDSLAMMMPSNAGRSMCFQ